MTRKKSNVKALALAVTCAILTGGGIGLEPVYAETPIYHDVVKYDSANRTLDYEFDAGAGTGTAAIQKINFGNIVLDGSSGAGTITATSLKLNGIGDVKTAIEGKAAQADVENNKNNIANLQTKTTKISYNATTGTTVEGAITATGNITANGGLSAANGRFTVKASGETVFNDETDLNKTTTIKAGETVVKGANGKVTINNSGINIAQKELGTNKDLSITLDSGYVDASGYVKAPKFIIDNDNGFVKEADGKSRLTVSDVDETGAVTNSVKIGGGNILASGDVNVAGTLCTNTILNATHGEGVTVDGVKFKAGAVSGISDINDGIIKFTKNGTENIVQINSDLMFNDDAGQQAATLTLEGVKTLNGLSNGSSKIEAGNGSVVGGVTFDEKNITDINDATVNNILKVKTIQSLDGNNEITVEEMATTKYNTDKITYDSTDGTTIAGDVMVNKGAQNQVKITNEGVVVGLGSTVIGSDGVYAGGHNYANAKAAIDGINGKIKGANGAFGVDDNGNVTTTGDIKGKDITASGKLSANGDAVVGGDLSVAGKADFTKEVNFSGGIKTDGIYEVTADKGVTVDGVLLKDGGVNASAMSVTGATGSLNVKDIGGTSTMIYTKKADGTNTIWIDPATGNISTNGTLQVGGGVAGTKPSVTIDGATGSIKVGQNDTEKFAVDGTTGNVKTEGSLEVASNATVGGTLGVTGKTTLNDELQVDKTATFGTAVGSQTVIKGDQITTGRIETDATQASKIGGVTLQNGKVTATDMTVTGTIDFNNLKVNDTLTVGINTKITEGTLQLGTADDNKLTADKLANINQTIKSGKVIEANSANIGGVEIKGGNVTATGTVQGNTISDGAGATLTGGKITAKEGKIGNVEISAAGAVTGVKSIEANTFKVDEENYLNGNGITAKGGHIGGAVIDATTLNIGNTTLDKANGISTNKLTIDGMTLTDTKLDTGTATFEVNGVKFNQGQVTAKASEGFVAGTSSFKQDSLIVDANNKLEATNGLTTEKATVKGALDVNGKATFGTVDNQTTINGKTVTTDTLKANKLILGASGTTTVEVNKDGSLKAANGAFNVDKDGKTTFKKDADNLSSINGGNIWAKATDAADNTSSELTHDYKGLHIKGNKSGQKSAFDFDTASGIGTFTGQDKTTTTINGSAIRSAKSDGTAGKLDGENLTLYKDDNNQTTMSAGKATFTGDAGEKGGKVTTINGGTISTDTLNVERINLGEDILDSNGNPHGSNLSMDKQGNFSAAGGNFKVTGGNTGSRGSITNVVGDATNGKTAFETNQKGANMSFEKGGIKSEVAVADDSAKISAGASSIEVKNDGIINNGVTTFNGTTGTTTEINGGTITTNHLITDKLTITGSGNADGSGSTTGSIAFGGNGSITSNIKDAATGKEATFKTDEKGTFTEAKDNDGNKTTNTVNAKGNTNVVTDNTNTSTATQTATSIGGVVTNGTVTMRQELTADGVKVSVDGDTANYTQITNKDVSITDQKNPGKRINLSDLGQLNDLDGELTARDEYTNNKTAVGAINAEAGIRREEVARLDNRIDDVNNRVDKVGAMAAAIASLKSIGYDPQAPSEFSIGLGQYKGETGVAMGFFHYPNKNFMINVSLSTAGGETMGGIGATWRFGHKSPQKLLEEQREAQAKKELAAAEKYQAAAKLAKEAQERAEYAAKLARQAQVSADNAKAAADATQAKHFG